MQPLTEPRVSASRRSRNGVDSGALGMALFIFTEVMLFAGFISAFAIVKISAPLGAWPPPDQPRLPIERTAINTLALLLSGVALAIAGRRHKQGGAAAANPFMGLALALGALFVGLQGMEWRALLAQGLTLTSSQLGSFFFVIIGTHALHAIVAVFTLALTWRAMNTGKLTPIGFSAMRLFWYFVVLVWPLLYWQVYL